MRATIHGGAVVGVPAALSLGARAPGQTAITYQGELSSGGSVATGLFDLRFTLFDDATTGNQVGATLCADNVSVEGGRFTVALDFGAVYAAPRFLQIAVRPDTGLGCADQTGLTVLGGRQPLTPAPSALYAAASADAATLGGQPGLYYRNASNLTGTVSDGLLSSNIPRLNFTSTFTAIPSFNGGTSGSTAPFTVDSTFRVTNLNTDLLDGLDSTAFAAASHTHDAGAVSSGTLPDARLSTNIPRLAGTQTWTGSNSFTGSNTFSGNGAGLTNLNATQIVTGQVADSRLPATLARLAVANTFTADQAVSVAGQFPLTVSGSSTGGTWFQVANTSAGGRSWTLLAAGSGNSEGAGKLLVRDNSAGAVRLTLDTTGALGVGTSTPAGRLDVTGVDPRIAIRNTNDPGGGYVQQTFGTLQLGLYNPGASAWGVVPAGGFRAMFGAENTGRVGSLTNTTISPTFRNLLDDGGGNASVQGNLTANNMPAIKVVTGTASGTVSRNGVTLIESIPVTIPASGYLRISARCRVFVNAYDFYTSSAILELKETTAGEVTLRQSVLGIGDGTPTPSGATLRGEVTIEHVVPVSAGTRTYKLRLLHESVSSGNNGPNGASYSDPEVTMTYFPAGL